MIQTNEEELALMMRDRDDAENEALALEQEIADIEAAHPEDYEDMEDWQALNNEINNLDNHAMYLTACIEDLIETLESHGA